MKTLRDPAAGRRNPKQKPNKSSKMHSKLTTIKFDSIKSKTHLGRSRHVDGAGWTGNAGDGDQFTEGGDHVTGRSRDGEITWRGDHVTGSNFGAGFYGYSVQDQCGRSCSSGASAVALPSTGVPCPLIFNWFDFLE